jgi:hypothetical protein
MSAKPAWLLHIPEIRTLLAEVTLPVIDRAIVERVFGLRRRQAIELMNRFGGYQAGRTLLIDRARLIAALDKILAGGEYQQESARHEKLTAALAQFQRTRRAEEVRIPVTPEVFASRMSTLPETVHLNPGKLEIEFCDCEDLLTKLFTLAETAANDFTAFESASNGTA